MFGITVKLSTYIFTGAELLIFCWQFVDYLLRGKDASKLRFLLLIGGFIAYNLINCFVLNNSFVSDKLVRDYVGYGSSIVLALYYYYFMIRELNIVESTNLNPRVLLVLVIIAFFLGLLTTSIYSDYPTRMQLIYMLLPVISSLYCCYSTEQYLRRNKFYSSQKSKRWFVYSAYSAITFMAGVPALSLFADFQGINISLINVLFLITVCAYIHRLILQIQSENDALNRLGYFSDTRSQSLDDFKLTRRQRQVAQLLLDGVSYPEIAETLFIAESTAYRHGSDIFKRTKTRTREEFEETFSNKE